MANPLNPNDHMTALLECAAKSPCIRDKRGALVVRDGEILGGGWNSPVSGECSDTVCHQQQLAWVGAERPLKRVRSCSGQVHHAEGIAIGAAVVMAIAMDSLADRDTFDDQVASGEYVPLKGCELIHLNTQLMDHPSYAARATGHDKLRVSKVSRREHACETCALLGKMFGLDAIWLMHHRMYDGLPDGTEWVRYSMDEYVRMAEVI